MKELVFGNIDAFFLKALVWDDEAMIEIGELEDEHYSTQAWFLSKDEVRALRDWLTDFLE